jgi:uncharacterized protein YndB with AHSA1/START domain
MAVISADKDTQELNFRIVAEFDADVKRVWRIWEDPRQLERWWGPPTWPATFDTYDFAVGGRAEYYMTGPDGEKAHGWWVITGIDAPTRLSFDDGFADEKREPMDELGRTHAVVTLEDLGGRTRMTLVTGFESLEQLDQMVGMGMEEGLKGALGQVDAILSEQDAAA